ncbi:MAG: hypothetical protein IK092_07565 [Muribaculaceae bacterium]|nr:hypothetical protein [Muribaculaceae bacterium]
MSTIEERTDDVMNDNISDEIKQVNTIIDFDIPRSHLGISLGMSWTEAKRLLENNGASISRYDEKVDELHNCIEVTCRYLPSEYRDKYTDCKIDIFNGKVLGIKLLPEYENQVGVVESVKKKYPFSVKEQLEDVYLNGYTAQRIIKYYSFSNGKTEIYINDKTNYICYRDVELEKAKQLYWEEADNEYKKEQQRKADELASDY